MIIYNYGIYHKADIAEKCLYFKRQVCCQAWWYTSVISALGRLRQEDHQFEANLGYIATSKSTWATQ
jgi:hypothetical protein